MSVTHVLVPGHASARVIPVVTGGRAEAVGGPDGAETVLDARPAPVIALFSVEQRNEALLELAKKAGPATDGIVQRVDAGFAAFRAELNQTAGGQASARVMLLSHNAQRAQLAVELQTSISTGAHGRYVENDGDKGQAEKGLRSLVGICAFATDLLNKAHAAAVEEGKAVRGSATDQLFATLGVRGQASGPDVGGGGTSIGASPSESFPFPKDKP